MWLHMRLVTLYYSQQYNNNKENKPSAIFYTVFVHNMYKYAHDELMYA
jgi:hypothetical protein